MTYIDPVYEEVVVPALKSKGLKPLPTRGHLHNYAVAWAKSPDADRILVVEAFTRGGKAFTMKYVKEDPNTPKGEVNDPKEMRSWANLSGAKDWSDLLNPQETGPGRWLDMVARSLSSAGSVKDRENTTPTTKKDSAAQRVAAAWIAKQAGWNITDDPDAKAVFNEIRDALAVRPLWFSNHSTEHGLRGSGFTVRYKFESHKNGTIDLLWTLSPELAEKIRSSQARLANNLWLDQTVSPKGVRMPRSKWDKLQQKPFDWATPAADIRGEFPEPWRVAHTDFALNWLKKLFRHPDLYTDHESDKFRGKNQIWVGLRDNRDKQAHHTRLLLMHDALKKAGWPVRRARDGSYLLLVDDIERDALR